MRIFSLVILAMLGIWLISAAGLVMALEDVKLPAAKLDGKLSVEAAMLKKKSVREFKGTELKLEEVSQLLWAANGDLPVDAVTSATSKVIPSAGGVYPLEVFLVSGAKTVQGLDAGVYRYVPGSNSLRLVQARDARALLSSAALGQVSVARAPATIVIGAVMAKSAAKYGFRSGQYVYMEAGCADQNLYLQAESLGLHAATVGAFQEDQVSAVLKLPSEVTPLLLVSVGK